MPRSFSNVLCNLIFNRRTTCGICYKTLEDNSVNLQDEVFLDDTNLYKISELIQFLLGTDITNTIDMFDAICDQCTNDVIKSYSFVKMGKENAQKLFNSIQTLTETFNNTLDDLPFITSMFVSLNTKDYSTNNHYDCKRVATRRGAYKRFISLCRNKQKPRNLVRKYLSEDTWGDSNGSDVTSANSQHTKLKKPRCKPVDIPLQEILFNVNEPQNVKCKVCLETRASLSLLKQHYLRVHAPKVYKCPDCPRKYGSPAILNQHRNDNHLNEVCSQCGKTFRCRTNLKVHELTHKQLFVCTDCGKTYKSIQSYRGHIRNNSCGLKHRRSNSDATFACDKCDKKYTHKGSLIVHRNFVHGDAKFYTCSWCNKKFDAPSRLKSHIVKHTKEKNFTCDICEGKFVTKESLIYHRRIHTGETPYECQFCDKKFLNASRRAEHMKRRHLEPSFECSLCLRKFKTRSCLMKHKNRHFNPTSKLHCSRESFDVPYHDAVEND